MASVESLSGGSRVAIRITFCISISASSVITAWRSLNPFWNWIGELSTQQKAAIITTNQITDVANFMKRKFDVRSAVFFFGVRQ
jgi:hypothetical protein